MPKHLLNDDEFSRLMDAMRDSHRRLEPFRRNRQEHVRQYVGSRYSDNGADRDVAINAIEQMIHVFTQNVASRNPRASVYVKPLSLRAEARHLQTLTNERIEAIDLNRSVRDAIMDAFFCMGVCKVGIEEVEDYENDGTQVGQVFVERVDLDDYVVDMNASEWRSITYEGNYYRLPLEVAKDSELFDYDARMKLTASDRVVTESGDGLLSDISTEGVRNTRFFDEVGLWDLYLPRHNLLLTVSDHENGHILLRQTRWDGPRGGPYRRLMFRRVPGQLLPLSIVGTMFPLHQLMNAAMRKLSDQLRRQKTILGIRSGSEDDANRIVEASDGDAVKLDNPESAKEYRFGGIDQQSMAFLLTLREFFNYYGGNLDAIGGLSPGADTLGQDQLLTASANKRVQEMADQVTQFARELVTDVAWYVWHDPNPQYIVDKIEGTKEEVVSRFSPADERAGQFFEYNFTVEPHSMVHVTPEQRQQRLLQTINMLSPLVPFMAQQGGTIDFQKLVMLIAEYSSQPELREIYRYQGVQGGETGAQDPESIRRPSKPPVTERTYKRVNQAGGPTRRGFDSLLANALVGKGNGNKKGE